MTNMVSCKACGQQLPDASSDRDVADREVCPRCGSRLRNFTLNAEAGHYAVAGFEVSSSVKTNLSGYLASSAALFSRKADVLERLGSDSVTEMSRMEHRSYSIGAVVAAASYLEAAINELYLEALDRNTHTFPAERLTLAELMSHVWADVEQMTILAKYQVALTLGDAPPYEGSASLPGRRFTRPPSKCAIALQTRMEHGIGRASTA